MQYTGFTPISIIDRYSATDMTVADGAVSGASHPSARDDSRAGCCHSVSSRAASNEWSVSFCTAASRRLRIKRVPCVLITILCNRVNTLAW